MAFSDRGKPDMRYRQINNLTIVVADRDSIYVSDGRHIVRFVRWFTPRGFYGEHWIYLEEYLMRSKVPTLEHALEIADRHEIECINATRLPNFNNKTFRRIK